MQDNQEIEAGLLNGEFFLEYLPVLEIDTGRCVGAEALSRWRRTTGIVKPLDFLPLVENTYLAGLLTCFVLEQIAKDFLDWLKENEAFISFNVPPEVIGRGGLRYVAEKTGLMDVAPKIVVEITERGVPDRIAFETINAAGERGIRIALDDVGTGNENIIVLSRCNVAIVKLDRQIVAKVHPDRALPSELENITHLLMTKKFEVIAEGVETAYQAEVMQNLGVRLAQGFFFSKPLTADNFKTFFAERLADSSS